MIGNYTFKDFGSVNFAKLREKYANNQYPASNFRENVKRLLRHLLNGTGDFEKKENGVEKWYTSPGNVSKAYSLLFLLHMDQSKSRVINAMTDEQLWESHDQFKLYDFAKFKEYNKRMKDLTSKRKERIRNEEAAFNRDMLKLPPKNTTARGYPFWNNHPASDLLKEDETNGTAKQMKPEDLWKSRLEYQDFPLLVFRKHIYQERMKQLAAPYWQHTRNKNAKKKYEEAQEMMKDWHDVQMNNNMEGLLDDWERLNINENR